LSYFQRDGKPIYLIGVNYWPRSHATQMWKEWDPAEIEADVKQMKALGMNVFRAFLYSEDFMPEPGRLNEEALRKLDELLAICARYGLWVIPSFFVGHMSGENWDLPWRKGRDFYTDPFMVANEARYVQGIAERYAANPTVLAWLLSNELPLYAGDPEPETAHRWTRRMYGAVKAVDQEHPVSTGDGIFSRGFLAEYILPVEDFLGPHVYGWDNDALRWSYTHAARVKAAALGKPVLLEEFGSSKAQVSEANEACYYRVALFSTFVNGAAGALGWCFSDFKTWERRPYVHHPHELSFGVTRADGSPRPSALEIRRFSQLIAKIDLERYRLPSPQAAVLWPSVLYVRYPFMAWRLKEDELRKVLLEAFTLAKMAHLDVGFLRELRRVNPEDSKTAPEGEEALGSPDPYRLVLIPFGRMLLSTFWRRLEAYVRGGGTLYYSFGHDPWCPMLEELFGVRHQLRYGVPDLPEEPYVKLTFARSFHGVEEGEVYGYRVSGSVPDTAFCPVEATRAEVLAVDSSEKPALTLNRLGEGHAVFCAYPIEYYLINTVNVHADDGTYRLYQALSRLSQVENEFTADNPFVELGVLQGEAGERLLFVISHSWARIATRIAISRPVREITDLETGEPRAVEQAPPGEARLSVSLEPMNVTVLRLRLE